METLVMEQTLSARKQIKTPKTRTHSHYIHHQTARLPNISRQTSNVLNHNFASFSHEYDMIMMHGDVLFNNHPDVPFHISSSLPPYFQHMKYNNNNNKYYQQPPLLPLPLPVAPQSSFRTLSGLGRSQSLSTQVPTKQTYKKSSPHKPKKENKNNNGNNNNNNNNSKNNSSPRAGQGTKELAKDDNENDDVEIVVPDPGSLPKDVTRMEDIETTAEMEKFSGSIFSMAPPPSSLPLPKFSLRQPKLSCTAEAAVAAAIEVDSGATDSLRRMLKLR